MANKPGKKMSDGSYYMGVSRTTGTDFFLFLENLAEIGTRPSFEEATKFLKKKHDENEEFHGHKFSAQQLDHEIIAANNDGTADGGIRRLTVNEWDQAQNALTALFQNKKSLRRKLPSRYIQTADTTNTLPSPNMGSNWLHDLDSNDNFTLSEYDTASLLVGRSEPRPNL